MVKLGLWDTRNNGTANVNCFRGKQYKRPFSGTITNTGQECKWRTNGRVLNDRSKSGNDLVTYLGSPPP